MLNDYKNSAADDLLILTINNQEDLETIEENVANFKLITLLDTEGEVGELYDISVLPETFFINRAGLQVSKFLGPFTTQQIQKEVNKL